jgi:hypothetical protein
MAKDYIVLSHAFAGAFASTKAAPAVHSSQSIVNRYKPRLGISHE